VNRGMVAVGPYSCCFFSRAHNILEATERTLATACAPFERVGSVPEPDE